MQDATAKYGSRGAQLYRQKIEQQAAILQKKLDTQLFESAGGTASAEPDFFNEKGHVETQAENVDEEWGTSKEAVSSVSPSQSPASDQSGAERQAPSVAGLSGTQLAPSVKKSGLGAKKTGLGAKKSGLGAVKSTGLGGSSGGLGAKKVTKSFDVVESKLKAEDEERFKMVEAQSPEVQEQAIATRLKYQESTTAQRDFSKLDENKRAQAERLGMGMGRATTNKSIFSHSASNSMSVIEQKESEQSSRAGFYDREPVGGGSVTPGVSLLCVLLA